MFNDDDFNKHFKRTSRLAGVGVVVSILVSLALTGVVIWAIVKLVTHFL